MNISSQMSNGIRSGHRAATGPQLCAFPVMIYAAQPNSTLLYKLSAELRLMIWEYAVGYQEFHIFLNHNRLCHRICNPKIWKNVREGQAFTNFFLFRRISLPSEATKKNLHGHTSTPGIGKSGERMRSRPGSFLCTCKQMYETPPQAMGVESVNNQPGTTKVSTSFTRQILSSSPRRGLYHHSLLLLLLPIGRSCALSRSSFHLQVTSRKKTTI